MQSQAEPTPVAFRYQMINSDSLVSLSHTLLKTSSAHLLVSFGPASIFSSFTCIYCLGRCTSQSFSVSYIAYSLDRLFHIVSISVLLSSLGASLEQRIVLLNSTLEHHHRPRPYHIPSNLRKQSSTSSRSIAHARASKSTLSSVKKLTLMTNRNGHNIPTSNGSIHILLLHPRPSI
jgi:hypothetical protein